MPKKIDPDATRSDKLLTLYRLLLTNNRKYSTTELTEILNCSKQSVRYIVDALNYNAEISIQEEIDPKTRAKRYFIEHGKPGFYEPIAIEGYRQMELCRDIVGDLLPEEDRRQLNLALLNASNYLVRKERLNFRTVSFATGLTKGYIDYSRVKQQLHDLYRCINEKLCCCIKHQRFVQGEIKTLCIAPLRLVVLHECFYVVGFIVSPAGAVVPKYAQPTNFAVQRIRETAIQEERSFEGVALPETEQGRLFGLIRDGEPFTVRLRFTSPYAVTYVSDRVFSQDQKLTVNADGTLDLSFSSDSFYEVLSFVLSYGSSVTVLEPQAIREAVREEAEKLLKQYS